MSISDVLENVLAECGIDVAIPQIDGTDWTTRQIRSLMDVAGRDIASRAEWAGASKTLVVAAVSAVDIPDDFQEMASKGAVALNKPTYAPVRAVTAAPMWQMLVAQPSAQPFYHIDAGQIKFSPDVDADGATIRYISSGWLVSGADTIASDADEPIFPDDLLMRSTVWRWKRQKGLPFDDELAEFEADLQAAIQSDRGAE